MYETIYCTLVVIGGTRMAGLDLARRHVLYNWIDDENEPLPHWKTVPIETFRGWAQDWKAGKFTTGGQQSASRRVTALATTCCIGGVELPSLLGTHFKFA